MKSGFFLLLICFIVSHNAYASENVDGYVVAELFTSQSCSSCPAADAVLERISSNENVIALGCHVTYWDHLNWKDTLSEAFCTRRQKNYAGVLNNSSRVYTPQLVVNGMQEMVGSDKVKVISSISGAAKRPAPKITIQKLQDNKIQAVFPALTDGTYDLLLFSYKDKHTQSISSGENRGRKVTYTNSVRGLMRLGIWEGDAGLKDITVTQKNMSQDGLVLLAQNRKTGRIVAAGKLEL